MIALSLLSLIVSSGASAQAPIYRTSFQMNEIILPSVTVSLSGHSSPYVLSYHVKDGHLNTKPIWDGFNEAMGPRRESFCAFDVSYAVATTQIDGKKIHLPAVKFTAADRKLYFNPTTSNEKVRAYNTENQRSWSWSPILLRWDDVQHRAMLVYGQFTSTAGEEVVGDTGGTAKDSNHVVLDAFYCRTIFPVYDSDRPNPTWGAGPPNQDLFWLYTFSRNLKSNLIPLEPAIGTVGQIIEQQGPSSTWSRYYY